MKITNEIKSYVNKTVVSKINNKIFNPYGNSAYPSTRGRSDFEQEEIKFLREEAIKKIKADYNVSDEILNNTSIHIWAGFEFHYKDKYEFIDYNKLSEKVIVELQLTSKKFKNISDIDSLIDEMIEKEVEIK